MLPPLSTVPSGPSPLERFLKGEPDMPNHVFQKAKQDWLDNLSGAPLIPEISQPDQGEPEQKEPENRISSLQHRRRSFEWMRDHRI